jgi:hypothetical protein
MSLCVINKYSEAPPNAAQVHGHVPSNRRIPLLTTGLLERLTVGTTRYIALEDTVRTRITEYGLAFIHWSNDASSPSPVLVPDTVGAGCDGMPTTV